MVKHLTKRRLLVSEILVEAEIDDWVDECVDTDQHGQVRKKPREPTFHKAIASITCDFVAVTFQSLVSKDIVKVFMNSC